MVAVHASIRYENRPVQPHKVETQAGVAQSRVRVGQTGYRVGREGRLDELKKIASTRREKKGYLLA